MTMDLETFARISALLDQGAEPTGTLAGYGLDADRWGTIQLDWATRFRQEAAQMRGGQVDRFIALYEGAAPHVNTEAAPVASPAASPAPTPAPAMAPAPGPPAVAHVAPTPGPEAQRSLPSYLAGSPPPRAAPAPIAPAPADPPAVRAEAPQLLSRATVMSDPGVGRGAPLPFAKDATHRAPPPARIVDAAPDPSKGFTAAPGAIDLNTLPFVGAKASGAPVRVDLSMMPLERYAELTLALAGGEPRESVLRRFVLTEDIWMALARAWGEQIASKPELRAEFDRHVRRLRGG